MSVKTNHMNHGVPVPLSVMSPTINKLRHNIRAISIMPTFVFGLTLNNIMNAVFQKNYAHICGVVARCAKRHHPIEYMQ